MHSGAAPHGRAPRTMILIDPALDSTVPPSMARGAKLPSARTLTRFLSEAQSAIRLRGQVTVLLTTDAAIRDLNRRFRGKDQATDVLSFPSTNVISGPEKIAGDLAVSVETARRQAAEQDHSLGVEIRILMLHGLLHLAGYDHETDAGEMEKRERTLRARLGLPSGLIERAGSEPASQRVSRSARRGGESASVKITRRRKP